MSVALNSRNQLFLVANLSWEIDGIEVRHLKKEISLYGAGSLPWHPLRPKDHFGKKISVTIALLKPAGVTFQTTAWITREQTATAQFLGIRFVWDKEPYLQFQETIRKFGFVPTGALRKYPRIPFQASIDVFPVRARVYGRRGTVQASEIQLSLEMANISPEGLLLRTENPAAFILKPGQRVDVVIEPRSGSVSAIEIPAIVRRLSDELEPETSKHVRSYGLQFEKMDDANLSLFKSMLREILIQIQREAKA